MKKQSSVREKRDLSDYLTPMWGEQIPNDVFQTEPGIPQPTGVPLLDIVRDRAPELLAE